MTDTTTFVVREVVEDIGVMSVTSGPDAGTHVVVDRAAIRVGTSVAADVRLRDAAVSGLHCEIRLDGSRARVRDLASKNGTWIGRVRVHDVEIPRGTELRIGETTLTVGVEPRTVKRLAWHGGDRCGGMVGAAPAMQRLFAMIDRLAASEEPVLVRGESGTGKELVARALHDRGGRARGPFVVIDGGALSRTLGDAELFGHARGAFTGATSARIGALERAHGGTVFIDEIGDLPIDVQPKLLRFLEDGTVQRLGESDRKRVDVRVVAATHRLLERMVNEGTFREDLLHRLSVVELHLPPLRERRDDVPRIAHTILAERAPDDDALRAALDRALAQRSVHRWSGNVRELKNLVRRLVALGEVESVSAVVIGDEALDALRLDLPMADAKQQCIEAFERRYLERLMAECGGNVSEAARRADVDRGHLGKLVAKYRIKC